MVMGKVQGLLLPFTSTISIYVSLQGISGDRKLMEYEAGEFIDFYCLEGKNSAVVKRS